MPRMSTLPAAKPRERERTRNARMSSTMAAPMMVWATRERTMPSSSRTEAAMAVLVATRLAPTKVAMITRSMDSPFTRRSASPTRR